jgi:uncharacterized protein
LRQVENHLENYMTDDSSYPVGKLSFGKYDVPCRIEHEDLLISVQRDGGSLLYQRKGTEIIEKLLLARNGNILFNPVEPVNKPKEITPFFLIQFEQSLTIKPRETHEAMLTFPVEIACLFVAEDQAYTVLDIFSLTEQKYTLYGSPKSGLICRYWKSRVHTATPPSPDPLREGVMHFSVKNTTPRWIEVTQAVFSANEMKIFYDRSMVSTEAYMKILSETTAETGFSNTPPNNHLKKSVEVLASKKAIMTGPKRLMEEGI